MPVTVRVVRDPKVLQQILVSPQGPVYQDIFRRCVKVQNRAKQNLERAPRRIDTGRLRSDIHIQMVTVDGAPAGRVGFNVFYGLYVHNGTGIYGPTGTPIFPTTAKWMSWKGKKGRVYARSVKGMQPNPFLADALVAAKG